MSTHVLYNGLNSDPLAGVSFGFLLVAERIIEWYPVFDYNFSFMVSSEKMSSVLRGLAFCLTEI